MTAVYFVLSWFVFLAMSIGCWAWVEKLEKAGTSSELEKNLLLTINLAVGFFTLIWVLLGVTLAGSFLIRLMLRTILF